VKVTPDGGVGKEKWQKKSQVEFNEKLKNVLGSRSLKLAKEMEKWVEVM